MPRPATFVPQALPLRLPAASTAAVLVALAFGPASIAWAQEGAPPGMGTADEPIELADPASPRFEEQVQPEPVEPVLPPDIPANENKVDFEADELSYDSDADIVLATGNVELTSAGRAMRADSVRWDRRSGLIVSEGDVFLQSEEGSVRADSVTWNRQTGEIVGEGNVRFVDMEGNELFTSRLELTDAFEAGAMEDLLLALRAGGRLAAEAGERNADGTITLERAAYSACAVTTPEGCDKDPSWRITADRVIYDPDENRVRFRGAFLELFGQRVVPLPGLSIRTDGRAASGFLIPDVRFSESNGVEVSGSYYWRMAPNRDLTLGAAVFTDAPPMISGQWRHLTERGAYQVTGYATQSRRVSGFGIAETSDSDVRGYIFANGRFQLDPHWSLTGSLRLTSDRTFLRRYDISRDDRLRSMIELERIGRNSYFRLAGWGTQTLRINTDQGQVPLALPVLDYRKRFSDSLLGGTVELQANSLAIHRAEGQDTQRAFAGARWDLRKITPLGQLVTLTGLVRGDVYHSDENFLTATASYRGNPGWEARGVAIAAADMQWPLVGPALGGTQVFTPRVQLVASPPIRNLAVPNEDARAVDLEDSNLFALNRFPGYDRVEDGARITYGFDWQLDRPGWRLAATLGQSYRFDNARNILPDGTGLSEKLSDFVGRTEIRYRDFVKFTHRYRVDKDSFAVRRNEFDATVGTARTYAEVGYLRLNRDISGQLEDLQDREEIRAAGRVAFARYWSIFGAGVFNLTNFEEEPNFQSDGFQPIRTRLGVAYQDDCLELGLTWRRDYTDQGDAERGDTFQLFFSLRNLGFR